MLALFLDHTITDGGGFNASMQLANDLRSITEHDQIIICTNKRENLKVLSELGWQSSLIHYNKFSRILDIILNKLERFVYYPKLVNKLPLSALEKYFVKLNVNHVVFLSPSRNGMFLRNIRYSMSIWDLAHRDKYHSAEFYEDGEWYYREQLYKETLPRAHRIFVESDTTKKRVAELYNILSENIIINKFTPIIHLKQKLPDTWNSNFYIFYPAQYWQHKDHESLINALYVLRNDFNLDVQLICCGSDKGYLAFLKKLAVEKNLIHEITFLSFVTDDELQALYNGCELCVFPSKLGPTNLPPLEALLHGKPVILADTNEEIEGVDEQLATYFKTGDYRDLAEKIDTALDQLALSTEFDFSAVIQKRAKQNIENLKEWYNSL